MVLRTIKFCLHCTLTIYVEHCSYLFFSIDLDTINNLLTPMSFIRSNCEKNGDIEDQTRKEWEGKILYSLVLIVVFRWTTWYYDCGWRARQPGSFLPLTKKYRYNFALLSKKSWRYLKGFIRIFPLKPRP